MQHAREIELYLTNMGAPKLTKSSTVAPSLLKELENGEIKGSEPPKFVWQSKALYRENNLGNIIFLYDKLQKKLKISVAKSSQRALHTFSMFEMVTDTTSITFPTSYHPHIVHWILILIHKNVLVQKIKQVMQKIL